MENWSRKDLKRAAKGNIKRNFLACFVVCLVFTFISIGPLSISKTIEASEGYMIAFAEIVDNDNVSQAVANISQTIDYLKASTATGTQSSAGALHSVYSLMVEAGSVSQVVSRLVSSILDESRVGTYIAIGVSFLALIFVRIFVGGIMGVGVNRFFLENRLYSKTKVSELIYIYRVRRTWHTARILILMYVFLFLWLLTIVGFIIKRYSYYMVPYIVAENPDVPIKEVFRLSEKMMKGHKWNTFVLEVTFLPWHLLAILTFGILDYLYLNPYIYATKAELYTAVRSKAFDRNIDKLEFLNDKYLFEVSDESIDSSDEENVYPTNPGKINLPKRFAWLRVTPKEEYSTINLIFMFFIFSFIGWVWECLLEYYKIGILVNRGTMWGPWVPIYGAGGLIIIVFLNRFAGKPLVAFFASVIVAGLMEYLTATILWHTQGLKYWDYTGYFLNIQGKICLEGLLFFGILGLIGIYFFAPIADSLLERIPIKIRWWIATALVLIFVSDKTLTAIEPRTGEGITYDQ